MIKLLKKGSRSEGLAAGMDGWKKLLSRYSEKLTLRLRHLLATRADLLRHQLRIGFKPRLRRQESGCEPRFFFSPQAVPALCAIWRRRLPDEAAQTIERAERVCRHRFDLLGFENIYCGVEIDWHGDPVHGKQAPRKPWFKLQRLLREPDFERIGDLRIIWELNRHQHLITLAKAYRLTGNGKFATEAFCQWRDWHALNRYPMGVNWLNSAEVAFRSLSWFWLYFLLADSPQLPPSFRAEWMRGLSINGRHLERYAVADAAPGARLLAEGVALFFIGTLCPELEAAERWKHCGWEIVLREAQREVVEQNQSAAEEVRFEQSTCHYVYSLDLFLHASVLASLNQVAVPAEFERVLEKMLEVLCLLGRAGAPPRLGGDDGGRLFDPLRNQPEHLLDPLSTGAILFSRGDFKYLAGDLREETLWLLGEEGVVEFEQLRARPPAEGTVALPAAGLYLMANAEREQQLVIDARPRNALGAVPGHGVALSVSVNRGGRALVIDPSALEGAEKGPVRVWPRNANAHNALLVDGMMPARPGATLARAGLPNVKAEGWVSGRNFDLFVGSHNGYSGPELPLLHRRWVFSLQAEFWLVRDLALGAGTHALDLFWHLCPELSRYSGATGTFFQASGGPGLRVLAVEGHGWSQEIRQGWWSPVYGRREPLNVLHFSTVDELPVEFATVLAPIPDISPYEGSLSQIRQTPLRGLVTGYCYETAAERHSMFFGDGKVWMLGPWSSDAEFLYWGGSHDGRRRVLICCNGSFVEASGRRIISCARQVLRCELVLQQATMDFFLRTLT